MRRVMVVLVALVAGCSFAMPTPQAPAGDDEPTCHESYVRPGFDGTLAAANAIAGALAVRSLALHGCSSRDSYGYPSSPSCGVYGLYLGGAAAATAGFTAGAIYGTGRVKQCERINDEYDRTHQRRRTERDRRDVSAGVGTGLIVGLIIDGILILSFPNR